MNTRPPRSGIAPAALLAALLATIAPAAAADTPRAPDRRWLADVRKPAPEAGAPVAGLPHAQGRTFRTLDSYLAYLRAYAAPTDRPWFREVRPDVFRLETSMRGAPVREFTRGELERRFGFARAARD